MLTMKPSHQCNVRFAAEAEIILFDFMSSKELRLWKIDVKQSLK